MRYLIQHTEAADTARGIAEWWIGRDVGQTADALQRLQAHGIVRSHFVQEAASVYGLTRNSVLRTALTQYVQALPASSPAPR